MGGLEEEMKLYIWAGAWGLPSIDPDSLQCLANIRFAGVPVKINECNNPWRSPVGRIPFLQVGSQCMQSPNDISAYLRSRNFSADYGLSSVECAETLAYMEFVWDTLQIAYQYFGWVHQANFDDVMRPFIGKRLPWVYKMWYPEKIRKRAVGVITSVYSDAEGQPESVERYITQKTQNCIKLLSEKLGSREFFMGKSSPTTIDSVVFSYLSFFWKVPLAHNPVKEFIKATPTLESYLARILQRYFPVGPRKIEGQISSTRLVYGMDGEVIGSDDSTEYPLSHKIFAIVFTTALMMWYGYRNQIVRLPRSEPSIAQEDDDEYWE